MGSRRVLHSASRGVALCAAAVLLTTATWAADTTKLIYSFAGDNDGEYTDTELAIDAAGNLFGTSVQGGAFGGGTVFQLSPAGVHTVLYNFTGGRDGGEPYKGVTLDAQGNLYGTAVTGGGGSCEGGCGVVFELKNSGGSWDFSVIHTFSGADGSGPGSPVTIDKHGNVYGTTPTGGANGVGVVYQLKPDGTGRWRRHVIYTFTGGADGQGGSAGRLLVNDLGHLFGACTVGGVNGLGTVYELAPNPGQWRFTTLYAFKGARDGALPYGGLLFGKSGHLYGTTYYAGTHGLGTVYKLTHHRNGTWTHAVLYSFKGGSDGASPISNVVADATGSLYGTTSDGGSPACSCGVIFKMSQGPKGRWSESVVYRFPGTPNPGFAYNGMVGDDAGNFYGATVHGGSSNDGAIYKFTP